MTSGSSDKSSDKQQRKFIFIQWCVTLTLLYILPRTSPTPAPRRVADPALSPCLHPVLSPCLHPVLSPVPPSCLLPPCLHPVLSPPCLHPVLSPLASILSSPPPLPPSCPLPQCLYPIDRIGYWRHSAAVLKENLFLNIKTFLLYWNLKYVCM